MSSVYASTDTGWIEAVGRLSPEDAKAFWQPTPARPSRISQGEFWFFKEMGRPVIRGFGTFESWEVITIRDLFSKYGSATGYDNIAALLNVVQQLRKDAVLDTSVGNVVLRNTRFFDPPKALANFGLKDLSFRFRYAPDGHPLEAMASALAAESSPLVNAPLPAPLLGPTRGLVPTGWTREVEIAADKISYVYGIRFGQHDIWKIGWATDLKRRLKAINDHIPSEVVPDQWRLVFYHQFPTKKLAFAAEQQILSALSAYRTTGERARCSEKTFQLAWANGLRRINVP